VTSDSDPQPQGTPKNRPGGPGRADRGARKGAKRPVVAVEDEDLRRRIEELHGGSGVDFETLPEGEDPLEQEQHGDADLVIVRRSSLDEEGLARLEDDAASGDGPDVVVVTEGADDLERTRLLSQGVSSLLESSDPTTELRDAVRALTQGAPASDDGAHGGHGKQGARLADFRSRSPRMRRFLDLVERVVHTDSSLLITGETGVGKERLALAMHNEGRRAGGPFVSVNCGAIPESLLESELFGHEEGAFTGADRQKPGRFELADGGTIFLDEIGEMPTHLQVHLLTVLQRRSIFRVGGQTAVPFDARVVAATNRDLTDDIASGKFREDLYYRLNVVTLEIPPLRERAEDIPDLVGTFIRHFRRELGRSEVDDISEDALDALVAHPWPGNVRELINAVEHAIVLCRGSRIEAADLPETVRGPAGARPAVARPGSQAAASDLAPLFDLPLREARAKATADFERAYLEEQLRREKGRIGRTAERAGITTRSLYDKLKQHGLRKEDFR